MNRRTARLAFVWAFLFAACGGSDDKTPGEKPDEPALPLPAPAVLEASKDELRGVQLRWTMPEGRAPEAIVIERSGAEVARLPADATMWRDDAAASGSASIATISAAEVPAVGAIRVEWSPAQASAGRSYDYTLVALYGADRSVRSNTAAGARAAPNVTGYKVVRDGTELGVVGKEATSYDDDRVSTGGITPPRDLVANADGARITLSWTLARVQAGSKHHYRVEPVVDGGLGHSSEVADARLAGPQLHSYRVKRDGVEIAQLATTADSYADATTAAGSAAAPTALVGTQGSIVGAVGLTWTAPVVQPGTRHTWQVFADLGTSQIGTNEVEAARAAPALTGYRVERDGSVVAGLLPPGALAYPDAQADAGIVTMPGDVTAVPGIDAIRLGWSPAAVQPGTMHAYRVVALFQDDEEHASNEVTGFRAAPSPTGYRIERDGVEIGTVDAAATGFDDATADAGRIGAPQALVANGGEDAIELTWQTSDRLPGTTHGYVVSTLSDDGALPAPAVHAARLAPEVSGWVVQRDGTDRATLDAATFSFTDTGAAAGSLGAPTALVATAGTRSDGVELTWSAAAGTEGTPHSYTVLALVGAARGPVSAGVVGVRQAPSVDSYVIRRDGVEIATVAGTDLGWLDTGAASTGAPASLTATQGVYYEAVGLTWTAPGAPPSHGYSVHATSALGSTAASNAATGHRANGTVVGYEFSRDDGITWLPTGSDRTVFDDLDAPLGTITGSTTVTRNGLDGRVDFSSTNRVARAPAPSSYRVRALTADGTGAPSPAAQGYRKVGTVITTVWQESAGDMDGGYTDLPGTSKTLVVNEVRYFRARFTAESAVGIGSAVRVDYLPYTQIAVGDDHTCAIASDGSVRCGGFYSYYFLPTTRKAPDMPGSFTRLVAGDDFTCALRVDGGVSCTSGDFVFPGFLPATDTYLDLAAGAGFVCGIGASDNRIVCNGQTPPVGFWQQLDATTQLGCAIDLVGAVGCWGPAAAGVTPPAGTFSRVAVGLYHGCAIRADQALVCFGDDTDGKSTPPTGTFTDVAAARRSSCGLRTDGSVVCWGAVAVPPAGQFLQIDARERRYCGVHTDGTVACWSSSS